MGFYRLDLKTPRDDSQRETRISKTKCLTFVKSNLLLLAMLIGVAVGIAMGIGLNSLDPKLTGPQVAYVRFPGDLFIQLMKMLLIPIVVSSLLCSVAEINIRSSGKIGLRALAYYLGTLVLASALAITLALTIRPGDRLSGQVGGGGPSYTLSTSPGLVFMDLVRNMVPDNLIEVFFTAKKTSFVYRDVPDPDVNESSVAGENNVTADTMERVAISLRVDSVSGTNMIGLVVASIVFGCVTSVAGDEAKLFLDFFRAVRCVSFRLLAVFIWYAPVGIAFLIASKMAEVDDPAKAFKSLGIFFATAMTGLVVHGFVVIPLIYLIVVRRNPFRFFAGILPAFLFAFGSESSAATLPLTIKCLEEKNGVDPRVTKLIASVGATVNMDGTCLYFTMMAIFVAQLNNVPLSAGELVTVSILALSIAMGAAGIPGAGVVYMIMILTSMGLPTEDISTLLAVDWFLARCRTAINVMGDGYGAGIIEHLSRHELRKMQLTVAVNGSVERVPDGVENETKSTPM